MCHEINPRGIRRVRGGFKQQALEARKKGGGNPGKWGPYILEKRAIVRQYPGKRGLDMYYILGHTKDHGRTCV